MAEDQSKANAGGMGELASLKSRVDELGGLMKQWRAARGAAVKIRVVIVLVILLFILGYGAVLLKTVLQVRDPAYGQDVQRAAMAKVEAMKNNLMPKLSSAYKDLGPVYKEAALADLRTHRDEIVDQAYAEVDALKEHAITRFRSTFDQVLHDLAEKQRSKLKETFPDIKTDADLDTIIDTLQKALSGAAYDVLNDRTKKAHARLQKATETTLQLVPEDRRAQFHQRTRRFIDHVMIDTLDLRKQLGEETQ